MTALQGFQFKKFFISHKNCAMKVSTDSVMLGGTCFHSDPKYILDLGAGSGILSLMVAQRFPSAYIEGIEICKQAYQTFKENINNSPFYKRVNAIHSSIEDFKSSYQYDLVISNPPYFENNLISPDNDRTTARHINSSHLDWLKKAFELLTDNGKVYFILPSIEADNLIKNAININAYIVEEIAIFAKKDTACKRKIITFSKQKKPLIKSSIIIYNESGQYSDDFRNKFKDFYLNF